MKPRIAVTRETFPEVIAFLREHFEVDDNQADITLDAAAAIGAYARPGEGPWLLDDPSPFG